MDDSFVGCKQLPKEGEPERGSTISLDLIMLPRMSASEFTTIDRILNRHEDELIQEALAEIPTFIRGRQPRVMYENNGATLGRWLMFGRPPNVEWLELRSLGYYVLTERYVDGDSTDRT